MIPIGAQVRWKHDPFGYYGTAVGTVTRRVMIARAYELGWDDLGVIEVRFQTALGECFASSHESNFSAPDGPKEQP